jgi:hypothetical protein
LIDNTEWRLASLELQDRPAIVRQAEYRQARGRRSRRHRDVMSMLMGGLQQPTCVVRISMRLVPILETDFDSLVSIGAAGIEIWLRFRAMVSMLPRFD